MEVRQLPAACARSAGVSSTWTSFSASAKVAALTSGPTGGAAPNVVGAPGGRVDELFWARLAVATVAPSRPSVVWVKNSLRDFDMIPLVQIVVRNCLLIECGKRNFEKFSSRLEARSSTCECGLVGNLPAHGGLREDCLARRVATDGRSHVREGGLNLGSFGPDGDIIHHVVIDHGGLVEAVGYRRRSEAVDAGDLAMTVAEARRVA